MELLVAKVSLGLGEGIWYSARLISLSQAPTTSHAVHSTSSQPSLLLILALKSESALGCITSVVIFGLAGLGKGMGAPSSAADVISNPFSTTTVKPSTSVAVKLRPGHSSLPPPKG